MAKTKKEKTYTDDLSITRATDKEMKETERKEKELKKRQDNSLGLPRSVTKFLVLDDNQKYLAWQFGRCNIYVDNVQPVCKSPANGHFNSPTVVTVLYDEPYEIFGLLATADPRLGVKRIFKTCERDAKSKDKIDAFIATCAKNLLNIAKGSTIRVHCKDDNILQKRFYDAMVKVNKEDKTGCKFDFDRYNILFWIRRYEHADGSSIIITGAEGLDTYKFAQEISGLIKAIQEIETGIIKSMEQSEKHE